VATTTTSTAPCFAIWASRRSSPRRGTEHGSGWGKLRWVVEQSFALLHWFRRLRTRWEIRDDIHEALLKLGCALICWRRLHISKS
jgi:hypothetical protein